MLKVDRELNLFQFNLRHLFYLQAVAAFYYFISVNTSFNVVTSLVFACGWVVFFRIFFDLPLFFDAGVTWTVKRVWSDPPKNIAKNELQLRSPIKNS